MSVIRIERKVMEKNDAVAARIRNRLREHGIFAINIISSPGSGKTAILEKAVPALANRLPLAVIEGG